MEDVREATSYMKMIFIDSEDLALQTNVGAAMDSSAETLAAFNACRRYEVPIKTARFLLDYHDAEGDLIDTIALDIAGFEAITGEMAKTEDEYRKIDADYWALAYSDRAALAASEPQP